MNPFAALMEYYPYLFHPAVMVGGGLALLIGMEWRRDPNGESLSRRLGVLVLLGAVSLLPTLAYMLVTGQGPMETMQGNAWQVDFLVGSGMLLVAGVMWYLWRRLEWGTLVPGAAEALAAVTLPYLALSPVWNVSGHVIFSVMPTLYLALVDRRFLPLLAVPVVMVPNRLYLDAHTWPQAVGGFLVAAVLVVWVFARRHDGAAQSIADGTST